MIAQLMPLPNVAMWPCAALIIFMAFMLGVFAWVLRPDAKRKYKQIGEELLKEDEVTI